MELVTQDEALTIGREMVAAYVRMVEHYAKEWQQPLDEAARSARPVITDDMALAAGDYRHVSFARLTQLLEHEPDEAMRVWREIKRLAEAELRGGHYAAQVLGVDADPWQKAQYVVLRQGFIDEWLPRGGVEQSLIDMLAQSFVRWQQWQEHATAWANVVRPSKDDLPRLSAAEALEQATQMADRYNRIYLRTLRALRDLRVKTQAITINNPKQVNLGQQQVITGGVSDDNTSAE